RYEEATLERLLSHAAAEVRQAAVLALGLLGTMQVNVAVATRLHDDDATVCQLACDALWSLWFRGDAPDHARELQRLMRHELNERNAAQVLDRYAALIKRAPAFAEAYNQRAIVHFRLEAFASSIEDCHKVLNLNPVHFGAASGMGQCYMKLNKPLAARRCYRKALRINPTLDGVREMIESRERTLGEEDRR